MSNNNCGCHNPNAGSSSSNEYLMIKASGASASTCGDPGSAQKDEEDCSKTEPMFDVSLGDFLVPANNGSTNIQVCNASIYSVGMWIQFLSPYSTFIITNITDNIITVSNRCADGGVVESNPDPGAVVSRGSKFVVADEPFCQSAEEALEIVQGALSKATELCVPKLLESSSEAIIHPVGRVWSDPNDSSAKRCIRRIYGFLFKGGTPVLSRLSAAKGENFSSYRLLVKHKTSHEVRTMESLSEWPGVFNTSQRALSVMSSGEKLVGPAWFFRPGFNNIFNNTTSMDFNEWPTISNKVKRKENMKDISRITSINRQSLDTIWVNIKVEFSIYSNPFNYVIARLNENEIGRNFCRGTGSYASMSSVTVPVEIDVTKNSWDLNIEFESDLPAKLYYKVTFLGVWF